MKDKKISKIQASKEDAPKESKSPKRNIWKIVAIGVFVVFVLVIIGGIIRLNHFRSSIVKPTQEQIDYSKAIAIETLQSAGVNTSGYEIRVAEHMRKIPFDGNSQSIIQVSLYNNTTTHMYLIDLDSKEIVLHSQTDVYKQLPGNSNSWGCKQGGSRNDIGPGQRGCGESAGFRQSWFHKGFFGRG